MKNFFKRILNFFRPEKKKVKDESIDWLVESEVIEEKIEKPKPHTPIYYFAHHKMSFKKPQPIGRILTFGKYRFRIHSKIPSIRKFKYDMQILT